MYLLNEKSSEQYTSYMTEASQLVKEWLDTQSLYAGGTPQDVNVSIKLDIKEKGMGIDAVFQKMQQDFLPNCISTAHSQCLAHLHPPTLVIGQIAELFIAATNQSMDSWNQSPVATSMETQLIAWLNKQCQFTDTAAGVFTSGGTQSNLMGVLLARNKFYEKQGVKVHDDGLLELVDKSADIQKLKLGKVLCSDQAHFSVEKNAALIGLGKRSVVKVATDASGKMLMTDLQQKIVEIGFDNVIAVVATAGTTDSGAIDPINEIADICEQSNIWLHVDGAWGGALILSHKYKNNLYGIERADSVTLDFHKHFFLPISCGAFLLRDGSNYKSISYYSDYLNPEEDEKQQIPNLVTYSLQTTRRFDALKLWLALEFLGTKKYGELVDVCIDTTHEIADFVATLDDFILVTEQDNGRLSSVMFYFDSQFKNTDANKHMQLQRDIAQTLLFNNIANLTTTQFKDCFCLKLTIVNPSTQLKDVEKIFKQAETIGKELVKKLQA